MPNTGGPYPATVVHRADAIVTTDLDTGEHTAALVELKGEAQVGERQPRPAAAKKIRGRTLDVDVLTGGEGSRLSRLSARGVTPSPPQEVEDILPWSKAKNGPLRQVFPCWWVCSTTPSPVQRLEFKHGPRYSVSGLDRADILGKHPGQRPASCGRPLPIEQQSTTTAIGLVSLMGRLTAFVSRTTMALVGDGEVLGSGHLDMGNSG